MFDHPSFDRHERVVFAHHPATGLRALVALHSTALGPAAGGSRFWHYRSTTDALTDALRLSRGMSYSLHGQSIAAEIQRIPERLTEIFTRSRTGNRPTSDIADEMARQLLAEAR